MSRRLTELCEILVENTYGDLAAQTFSTLAEHGRLSLIDLHQLTHIPLRRLRTTLGILIQHHILLHHADDYEPTHFQVDWQAAYTLVRSYKVTKLVDERASEAASTLVENILQLGHASVGDLADAYELSPCSKRDSGIDIVEQHTTEDGMINGIAKDHKYGEDKGKIDTVSKFHLTLRDLLSKGYLVKVGNRSYVPQADLSEQLRDAVIAEKFRDGKITGPKKQMEFRSAFNTLKREWQDEDAYSDFRDIASHGTIKRSKASPSSNKRVKVNGNLPSGIHCDMEDEDEEKCHSVSKLPNDMVVRVNYAKCIVILRTQRLERMAERFLGPATTAVFGTLLRLLEDHKKPVRDKLKIEDEDSEGEEEFLIPIPDARIDQYLDKSIDLTSTIKGAVNLHKAPKGAGHSRDRPEYVTGDEGDPDLGIKQEAYSDSEDEPQVNGYLSSKERFKRLSLIEMHLQLLAEHPKRFCIRTAGKKESRINFAALNKTLIQAELDIMINARFGQIACADGSKWSSGAIRIVRMLREKGKLEDKQIAAMSMMRIKDVRAVLTLLQFHGIAEMQELPKDNGRQPSRTVYLWFFDEERVRSLYLEQTYHAMTRTLQRVKVERETKFKAVIAKAERSDVRGREQELLGPTERELLRQWRDVEEALLVQVARMDDVVSLLRDFNGKDTSFMT